MKYEVDINNDDNDVFENKADNVGMLQVFDNEGKEITEQSTVSLSLSKNALLGLGTELIRMALTIKRENTIM